MVVLTARVYEKDLRQNVYPRFHFEKQPTAPGKACACLLKLQIYHPSIQLLFKSGKSSQCSSNYLFKLCLQQLAIGVKIY
mmetsp:Transcript_15168/g.18763  ORF Transcript_15168/g.18763 Transcript_15168/m.18763 type:complete len:80 (+) Transcript_15168:300-539(+)